MSADIKTLDKNQMQDTEIKPLEKSQIQIAENELYVVYYGDITRLLCIIVMGIIKAIGTGGLYLIISIPKGLYHSRQLYKTNAAYTKCSIEMKTKSIAFLPRPYWATFWTVVQTLVITFIALLIPLGELLIGVDCIADSVMETMFEKAVTTAVNKKADDATNAIKAPQKATCKNGLRTLVEFFWRTTLFFCRMTVFVFTTLFSAIIS